MSFFVLEGRNRSAVIGRKSDSDPLQNWWLAPKEFVGHHGVALVGREGLQFEWSREYGSRFCVPVLACTVFLASASLHAFRLHDAKPTIRERFQHKEVLAGQRL